MGRNPVAQSHLGHHLVGDGVPGLLVVLRGVAVEYHEEPLLAQVPLFRNAALPGSKAKHTAASEVHVAHIPG